MFPPRSKHSLRTVAVAGSLLASGATLVACDGTEGPTTLESRLEALATASGAEVGLVYRVLDGRDSALVNPDLRMHAASTMKVPVMLQLYLDHRSGRIDLDEPVPVTTTFQSILDGSAYDLDPSSDSDSTLYGRVGQEVSRRVLIDRMITWSSNLATNLLIRDADPERVTATVRALGADSMEVLRGVEDIPAFEAGLSNTTTARDLARVLEALAREDVAGTEGRDEMLGILERQHFRDNIPAGIPSGVRVANKTGWITGINHDGALVFPENAPPYALVILLRGHPADDQGTAFAAELSRAVWEHHTSTWGGS